MLYVSAILGSLIYLLFGFDLVFVLFALYAAYQNKLWKLFIGLLTKYFFGWSYLAFGAFTLMSFNYIENKNLYDNKFQNLRKSIKNILKSYEQNNQKQNDDEHNDNNNDNNNEQIFVELTDIEKELSKNYPYLIKQLGYLDKLRKNFIIAISKSSEEVIRNLNRISPNLSPFLK
jgi:hypothetical protein